MYVAEVESRFGFSDHWTKPYDQILPVDQIYKFIFYIWSYGFFCHLVLYILGCDVIFSVIWFYNYSFLWIRSNGPVCSLHKVRVE